MTFTLIPVPPETPPVSLTGSSMVEKKMAESAQWSLRGESTILVCPLIWLRHLAFLCPSTDTGVVVFINYTTTGHQGAIKVSLSSIFIYSLWNRGWARVVIFILLPHLFPRHVSPLRLHFYLCASQSHLKLRVSLNKYLIKVYFLPNWVIPGTIICMT